MAEKSRYRTKQREELLAFFKDSPGRHMTAADVCEHFKEKGNVIGTATVYRQLEKMVEEGILNKYIIDNNSSACFEYIDPEVCHQPVCYHCKCERCGSLIHLECGELDYVKAHILNEHGFTVDPRRTVFYGICEECRAAENSGLQAGSVPAGSDT